MKCLSSGFVFFRGRGLVGKCVMREVPDVIGPVCCPLSQSVVWNPRAFDTPDMTCLTAPSLS